MTEEKFEFITRTGMMAEIDNLACVFDSQNKKLVVDKAALTIINSEVSEEAIRLKFVRVLDSLDVNKFAVWLISKKGETDFKLSLDELKAMYLLFLNDSIK